MALKSLAVVHNKATIHLVVQKATRACPVASNGRCVPSTAFWRFDAIAVEARRDLTCRGPTRKLFENSPDNRRFRFVYTALAFVIRVFDDDVTRICAIALIFEKVTLALNLLRDLEEAQRSGIDNRSRKVRRRFDKVLAALAANQEV